MIRTEVVKIASINALAYKQKLVAGGAGVTIITPDDKAVFTINKRNGTVVPYGQVNNEVFTAAIVNEVLELTKGMSYKRLGNITKVYADNKCDEDPVDLETGDAKMDIDVVSSAEYKAFLAKYTDKANRFSYQLMNKDLMQFAAKSSVVGKMLAEKGDVDEIVRYIVKSKAADLSNTKGMSAAMLDVFMETFDSMNTRSAFKEVKAYLRGKLSRSKGKGPGKGKGL